jgi:hypothetical protein
MCRTKGVEDAILPRAKEQRGRMKKFQERHYDSLEFVFSKDHYELAKENLPPSCRKPCVQKTRDYRIGFGGLRAPMISTLYYIIFSLMGTGKVALESISLELPVGVVPDSAKAYVTALGKQIIILAQKGKQGMETAKVEWGGLTDLWKGKCT